MTMLTTERLILRNFTTDDFPDFAALIRDKMDSEWHVYDNQWPVDDRNIMYGLAYVIRHDHWFAVELKAEKRLIGYVVAEVSEDAAECEIGYTLHRDYHRRGYAYEACAELMRMRAKDTRLVRFTAGTADCNYPSRGLLAKLGFSQISSETVSFAKDESGRPIEFSGSTYECSAERWRHA